MHSKQLNLFEEIQIDHEARNVLGYCRRRGFPHYDLTIAKKTQEFQSLCSYDLDKIIVDGFVNQTLHAMGMCWSYFPHHWDIRVRNMKTAVDVWNDDNLLLKAIKSRMKWGGKQTDGVMSESNLRKAIRTASGVQRVSNFRPSAAAAIYRKYCPDGGRVWDMSSGFGGRLVGAVASGVVSDYYGNDPSTPTFNGLQRLAQDFAGQMSWGLSKLGCEVDEPPTPVDLCFTSPPYFDTEAYSHDMEQSCLSYPSVDAWNHYFLRGMIKRCQSALKPNGYLILNVANVLSHKRLEHDTVAIAEEEGFILDHTLKMKLSAINFAKTHRYEPVFIFKHKG
jgi:hypothetical protein